MVVTSEQTTMSTEQKAQKTNPKTWDLMEVFSGIKGTEEKMNYSVMLLGQL